MRNGRWRFGKSAGWPDVQEVRKRPCGCDRAGRTRSHPRDRAEDMSMPIRRENSPFPARTEVENATVDKIRHTYSRNTSPMIRTPSRMRSGGVLV